MLFLGIDGEMSSSEIDSGGKLIQIGVCIRTAEGLTSYQALINPGEMEWCEEAAAVHQIPRQTVELQGRSQDSVDQELYQWLVNYGANPKRREKTVAVGFNIIGFDMPFIKKQLPKTYSLLSRRMADLNAMLWLLHGKVDNGMPVNFETWKTRAMDYAASTLEDFKPHDAEWDAKRHLLCFEYLRSVILD
jgi:hypothetical protein